MNHDSSIYQSETKLQASGGTPGGVAVVEICVFLGKPTQALFHDSLVGTLDVTTFELRLAWTARVTWYLGIVVFGSSACMRGIAVRLWRVAATTQGSWQVVELVHDDAYYYLTVAANTIEFGRTTLERLNANQRVSTHVVCSGDPTRFCYWHTCDELF